MASKRILKELKDLQKDPPVSCSAGVLGEKRKHVEEEPTSSWAKKARVAESGHDVGEGSGGGRRELRSHPKTLVPHSRVGIKRRIGSQRVADSSFEYEISSDDEVADPATGVSRRGVGYLFPTAPKQFMTGLLTGDDMGKLGKTKLDKKVKRMEKFGARFAGYGYGVAMDAYREREKRRRAERQVKALRRERDGLVVDMDLLHEDAQEGFAADKKRLEDQVKKAVNVANNARKSLEVVSTKLRDAEEEARNTKMDLAATQNANTTLSKRIKLLEKDLKTAKEQLAAVPSRAVVVEEYKATPMYTKDLENAVVAFRASRDFTKAVGAERRKILPLVVHCCREFFKDDLRRPGDGFETFFVEWIRANQKAPTRREAEGQTRREASTQP